MRILEIPSFFPPMGGRFCLEQAKALMGRGHEVAILACNQYFLSNGLMQFAGVSLGRKWEEMEGVPVYRSDMHALPRMVKRNQQRWCSIVCNMYDDMKRRLGRPDVLHAHCCQWAGVAASMIATKENIPFFVTEHIPSGLFEQSYGQGWTRETWAKDLIAETYRRASCVVTVSDELVDDLAPFFGTDYNHRTVSNVIDVDFFSYRERRERKNRPFRFCCLGNAFGGELQRKGYDVLAEAFRGIEGCELYIAGQGTDSEEMKALFPQENVVWKGLLDKEGVRELLYECDALVLASRSESAGLVLFEAAATGIPFVTTDAVPRLMHLPGACLIAEAGNAISLRKCMQEVMSVSPSRSFAEAVRSVASPEKVAQTLEVLFRS